MPATCAIIAAGLVTRPRFVASRAIEKPPQYGEKPYHELVSDAFDGPVLRLSKRLSLLEEADNRHIRRGDAIDVISATQRRLEKQFAVACRGRMRIFATRYAAFAALYAIVALAWCAIVALH